MRKVIIKLIAPFVQKFANIYFKKPRRYNYKNVKGIVLPTVFYPHFTWSTTILIDFVDQIDLTNKKALELGCGTGILSTFMAKKGAKVWASDINPKAIENAKWNADNNRVEVETIQSDLFSNIPIARFDYILVNPPYYPKKAKNMAEQAWYCGSDFEYFKRFFKEVNPYVVQQSSVYMILSEDCEFVRISEIAHRNQLKLKEVYQAIKWGELTTIYELKSV